MNINLRSEYVWSTRQNRYILVRNQSISWTGEVALCKGPTSDMIGDASNQQILAQTLHNDFSTQFADQKNILNSLSASLAPIVNAGSGQYGFSNAEDAAMRNQATAGTAGLYRTAHQAAGQVPGGNEFLGSGVQAQTAAQVSAAAAAQEANQGLGITQAGYQQGNRNYQNALSGEKGVADALNPTAYSGQEASARESAYGMTSKNEAYKNATNPWNVVGGMLGGAVDSYAGGLGQGMGGRGRGMLPVGAGSSVPQGAASAPGSAGDDAGLGSAGDGAGQGLSDGAGSFAGFADDDMGPAFEDFGDDMGDLSGSVDGEW